MEFVVRPDDRAAVLSALDLLGILANAKTGNDLTRNVLLRAKEDGTLVLHATDLDAAMVAKATVQVTRPGGLALELRPLRDVLRSTGTAVALSHVEKEGGPASGRVDVTAEDMEVRLPLIDASMFPNTTPLTADPDVEMTLPVATLHDLIPRVDFAMAEVSDNRYNIEGVYLEWADGVVSLVATDGGRMAHASAKVEGLKGAGAVLVPSLGVRLLEAIPSTEEMVRVGYSESRLVFRTASLTIGIRRLEGNFPAYQKVITVASETKVRARMPLDKLRGAVARAMLLAGGARFTRVELVLAENGIQLATVQDSGDARARVAASITGTVGESVAVNGRFLTDWLAAPAAGDVAEVWVGSQQGALTLVHVKDGMAGAVVESSRCVLMPVR